MTDDRRLYAPAVARNREFIWRALQPHLPQQGCVLEVASGSGEHIVTFAQQSSLTFQPSDPDAAARASIDAWVTVSGLQNVLSALALDAGSSTWPIASADMIVCINMIHISPWTSAVGLFQGAGRILPRGGRLFLYGPYRRNGVHTAASNTEFDLALRARNSEWGCGIWKR